MIVLDASVVVEVLLHRMAAAEIEERLFGSRTALHAPHLIDVEVAHALRRYAMIGEVNDERGRMLLDTFDAFPIRRHPHHPFLQRVWDFRHNLSAYDALYVALAEQLDATLVTRDRRLADSAERYARIELV